jgi:hypothetical protein
MKNRFINANLIAATVLAGVALAVPTVATADGHASPQDRRTAEANGWIYDDFDAGVKQAKATGKPIMVVLRCPP